MSILQKMAADLEKAPGDKFLISLLQNELHKAGGIYNISIFDFAAISNLPSKDYNAVVAVPKTKPVGVRVVE